MIFQIGTRACDLKELLINQPSQVVESGKLQFDQIPNQLPASPSFPRAPARSAPDFEV